MSSSKIITGFTFPDPDSEYPVAALHLNGAQRALVFHFNKGYLELNEGQGRNRFHSLSATRFDFEKIDHISAIEVPIGIMGNGKINPDAIHHTEKNPYTCFVCTLVLVVNLGKRIFCHTLGTTPSPSLVSYMRTYHDQTYDGARVVQDVENAMRWANEMNKIVREKSKRQTDALG